MEGQHYESLHKKERRTMKEEQMMDLGRKHGINMLSDLLEQGATAGEMLCVAAFALKGIMLSAGIKSGHDMNTIRKIFDECLDVWLEDDLNESTE